MENSQQAEPTKGEAIHNEPLKSGTQSKWVEQECAAGRRKNKGGPVKGNAPAGPGR